MCKTKNLGLVSLVRTCPACPSQWDAQTVEGKYLYIRYRFGHLTVDEADTPEEAVNGTCIFSEDWGGYWNGEMTDEEMLEVTGLVYGGELPVQSKCQLFAIYMGEDEEGKKIAREIEDMFNKEMDEDLSDEEEI